MYQKKNNVIDALRLLVILLCTLFPSAISRAQQSTCSKVIALVIGNNDYKGSNQLRNAVSDAKSVAMVFRDMDYDVHTVYNAEDTTMRDAIMDFGRRAVDYDAAIFYYAGHGHRATNDNRTENYMVPVNIVAHGKNDIRHWISVSEVYHALNSSNCKVKILILDACRDDVAFELPRSSGYNTFETSKEYPGCYVVYSTGDGEIAFDGITASPFAEALLSTFQIPNLSLGNLCNKINGFLRDKSYTQRCACVDRTDTSFYFNTDTTVNTAILDELREYDILSSSKTRKYNPNQFSILANILEKFNNSLNGFVEEVIKYKDDRIIFKDKDIRVLFSDTSVMFFDLDFVGGLGRTSRLWDIDKYLKNLKIHTNGDVIHVFDYVIDTNSFLVIDEAKEIYEVEFTRIITTKEPYFWHCKLKERAVIVKGKIKAILFVDNLLSEKYQYHDDVADLDSIADSEMKADMVDGKLKNWWRYLHLQKNDYYSFTGGLLLNQVGAGISLDFQYEVKYLRFGFELGSFAFNDLTIPTPDISRNNTLVIRDMILYNYNPFFSGSIGFVLPRLKEGNCHVSINLAVGASFCDFHRLFLQTTKTFYLSGAIDLPIVINELVGGPLQSSPALYFRPSICIEFPSDDHKNLSGVTSGLYLSPKSPMNLAIFLGFTFGRRVINKQIE